MVESEPDPISTPRLYINPKGPVLVHCTTTSTSMSHVKVHSTEIVRPDSMPIVEKPILGPLDQPVPHFIPIAIILVFGPSKSGRDPIICPDRLKEALKLALGKYPPLLGRLVQQKDGGFQVYNLDAGATFLTAESTLYLSNLPSAADLTLSHFGNEGNDLLAPFDMANATEEPILSVQHTTFACGGVSMGIRVSHKVCDAVGVFQFLQDLANVYNDPDHISQVEETPRPYLAPASDTTPQSSFYTIDPYPQTAESASGPQPPTTGRFIHLEIGRLKELKARAQDAKSADPITAFDALSAFILQAVHRARVRMRRDDPSISPLGSPCYLTSVNVRRLLGLSDRYINNCLVTPYFNIAPEAPSTAPLSEIARTLHDSVRSVTPKDVEDSARYIESQEDKTKLRFTFPGGTGSVMTSQWSRFNMYPQFDGHRPILSSTPFTAISLVDGLGYFLPNKQQGTPEDKGDLELCLALSHPLWAVLDEDTEWSDLIGAHAPAAQIV